MWIKLIRKIKIKTFVIGETHTQKLTHSPRTWWRNQQQEDGTSLLEAISLSFPRWICAMLKQPMNLQFNFFSAFFCIRFIRVTHRSSFVPKSKLFSCISYWINILVWWLVREIIWWWLGWTKEWGKKNVDWFHIW